MTTPFVARQIAKKMKLEDRLKPKLRKFFNQISKDVNAVWVATRSIPNLSSFNLELTKILRDHYRDVAKQFKRTTRDSLKSFFLTLELKQEENIDSEVVTFINDHSQEQSDHILRTTERILLGISASVVRDANTQVVPVTTQEIGREIQTQFDASSDGRVDTLAMTETQTSSERFKLIEATALGAILMVTPGTQQMFKTWNTVLDERTRLSHVEADRQRVPSNQPFRVQGQNLKVPGDTSLGASLDNIINCRCTAVFTVTGVEAPPLDIPRGLTGLGASVQFFPTF